MSSYRIVRNAIREHLNVWLWITFGFAMLYYSVLMITMIVRFGNWPNYVTGYDWFGNVARIIQSTPSYVDMLPIIRDEWLLEIGYMNMSFGHGISEWSLNLIPAKMLLIIFLGSLIATVWALAQTQRQVCTRSELGVTAAGSSAGATLVALTGATMSWVVCCATPSWIVGLAMMGMGVATANWLEPAGTWVGAAGFAFLAATLWWQIHSIAQRKGADRAAALLDNLDTSSTAIPGYR
ncbi:MAG: hypothetical protein AAF346_03655 [Pseudomonadota bacterium]